MALARDIAIKLGSHVSTDFTTADEIRNFPVQSDQNFDWIEFALDTWRWPRRASTVYSTQAKSHGYYNFAGSLLLSPDMLKYIKDTFFANDEASVEVTVRVYDQAGIVRYFVCQMEYPSPDELRRAARVGQLVFATFNFNRGVEVS